MLGLELDVTAFAAGPTARLSATVALVLTVVLVTGAPTVHFDMPQGRLTAGVAGYDRLHRVCSGLWHVAIGRGHRGRMPRTFVDSSGRGGIDERRAAAAAWGAAAWVRNTVPSRVFGAVLGC